MKHFIILDYCDCSRNVSIPIEDITSIRECGDYTEVYYGAENICRVKNSVQEVVKRINEVINNLNK